MSLVDFEEKSDLSVLGSGVRQVSRVDWKIEIVQEGRAEGHSLLEEKWSEDKVQ